jgi:hypothetical protein
MGMPNVRDGSDAVTLAASLFRLSPATLREPPDRAWTPTTGSVSLTLARKYAFRRARKTAMCNARPCVPCGARRMQVMGERGPRIAPPCADGPDNQVCALPRALFPERRTSRRGVSLGGETRRRQRREASWRRAWREARARKTSRATVDFGPEIHSAVRLKAGGRIREAQNIISQPWRGHVAQTDGQRTHRRR